MSRWFHRFIGRNAEQQVLRDAYDEARGGNPRVVAIVAESGYGKTRLVQEFYNWLSSVHDGVESAGYWPDRLLRREDNLVVNPDSELCGRSDDPMPFLWWAMRLADPGARNEVVAGALWPAVEQLKPHLAAQTRAIERARHLRQAAVEIGRGAADVAVDWLGNVLTFGLLGVGKTVAETGKALYDIKAERDRLEKAGDGPAAAGKSSRDQLAATILGDLYRLCKLPPGDLPPTPIVMVVDDAQWLGLDESARSFVSDLLDRARQERWPLLLVLTCWEREWRESAAIDDAPGRFADPSSGDRVVMLGRADALEALVCEAFPGLSPMQTTAIVERADGNPRFLDELLQFLDRSPRLFTGRDRAAALTGAGLRDALGLDLAELAADRFHAAPADVRRALGLASLQGVTFSERLLHRLAALLTVLDPQAAIRAAENPYSFVASDRSRGLSEFRSRAYHEVAREDLANHLDDEEAERALAQAVTTVLDDLAGATDLELSIVVQRAGPGDALRAGRESLARAVERGDVAAAGEMGDRLFPLLTMVNNVAADTLNAVIDAVWEYRGPRREVLPLIERGLADCGTDAARTAEAADFLWRIGLWHDAFDGPATALPWLRRAEAQFRSLVGETQTAAVRTEHLLALNLLGDAVQAFEGPERAMPLRVEAQAIARDLADRLGTIAARKELGAATARLGLTVELIEGPAAAHPLRVEYEALTRAIVTEKGTSNDRRTHQLALSVLGQSHLNLAGPAAAKPWFVRSEALAGDLALEFRSLDARQLHASALSDLTGVIELLEGPAVVEPMRGDLELRYRAFHAEVGTPDTGAELAVALLARADTLVALRGPSAAMPYCTEAEKLAREVSEMLETATARTIHLNTLMTLADLVEATEGPVAADPLRLEAETIGRALAGELRTPDALRSLSIAVSRRGRTLVQLGGQRAAMGHWVEAEALNRRLVEQLETPTARDWLASSLKDLGDAIEDVDGPASAEKHRREAASLLGDLNDECLTPTNQIKHAFSICALADTLEKTSGPGAVAELRLQDERMRRSFDETVRTFSSRLYLLGAIDRRAAALDMTAGAAAALPSRLEVESLSRALVDEVDSFETHNWMAFALLNAGETTGKLQEPDLAKSRLIEAEGIFQRLHALQATAVSKLNCLTVAKSLLSARLLGPAPWGRAFELESFQAATAAPLLPAAMALSEKFVELAEKTGTRAGAVRVASAQLLLAKMLLATGQAAEAAERCRRALPFFRTEALTEPGFGWQNLTNCLLALAACERALGHARPAATLLREAARIVLPAVGRGEVRALRFSAAVHWFLADALDELDHADDAVHALRIGLTEAKAFAHFGQEDGASILSVYRDRLAD